ncbi:MAG: type II toxin-antitoxin system RelB/DinJ family antitoxin [Deltaproteobacteria bacterium]|jgi:DNA-damage-inducible protein J|nr:type II toxin-antitoxin system RelB/DinJ family antitoxin [Deltaproteobacteria bacterium]
MSDSIIKARLQPELKTQATKVLKGLGLTPSAAIRIFLRQVIADKAIPFKYKAPEAEPKPMTRVTPKKAAKTAKTEKPAKPKKKG